MIACCDTRHFSIRSFSTVSGAVQISDIIETKKKNSFQDRKPGSVLRRVR